MMRLIALLASWDVMTENQTLVPRAIRCRANVQQKWATSKPIDAVIHHGCKVDSRGHESNTSVMAGNTR